MALAPGTRLGAYEIQTLIGSGGMGEVYRAKDTKLGRDIALKILPATFTNDPDRVARFRREAQVLASLNHPHIAQIHGLDEANGTQFLVLELVEGESLDKRIARSPIPVDEALGIAKQLAEALEAAHERGIIHRDLKPANVALTRDSNVKVLDFGLAKAVESTSGSFDAMNSPTITTPAMMTGVGVILGTAAYMSPDQVKGRPADKRSDIWAFGCVLYEMLTGKRAFEGEDVSDTLAAVLRGEPNWAALPATLPQAVLALIQGCLTRDSRSRISDVAVARFVVDGPLGSIGSFTGASLTMPRHSRWQGARALAIGSVLTAALVGAVAWRFWPRSVTGPVMRLSLVTPESQLFPPSSRKVLALSADGRHVAYIANIRIFLRSLSEFEAHAVPGTDGAAPPVVFSPDGQSLAFFTEGVIKRIAVTGGAPVTVCTADNPFGMTWHSSGLVVGQGRKGIIRCPVDGSAPQRLVSVSDDEEAEVGQMVDSNTIVFAVAKARDGASRWDKAQVVVQTVPSGARQTLINGGSEPLVVPTGHLVYSLGGVVFAARYDAGRRNISGAAQPVLEGVRRSPSGNSGATQIAISDTGSVVYIPGLVGTASNEQAIAIADRSGTITRLTTNPGPYTYVRASPNGSRLAVGSDDGKDAIIWIYDVGATTSIRRLTLTGHNRFAIWSADGQRIAYQSDREGDFAIFTQQADGTGAVDRLTKPTNGEAHVPEAWSPDGKHILYSAAKDATFTLWSLSVGDKTTMRFGDVHSTEPPGATFSPDGHWVAYASAPVAGVPRSPNNGVFVQPFPATGEKYQAPRVGRDFHPVWHPNGRELFYVPVTSRFAIVSFTTKPTVAFGTPTELQQRIAAKLSIDVRAYDILPDGRFVGLVSPTDGVGTTGDIEGSTGTRPQLRLVLNWFEELRARVP